MISADFFSMTVANNIAIVLAVCLCFLVVRDRLRIPLLRALLLWALASVGSSVLDAVLYTIFDRNIAEWLAQLVFLLYFVFSFFFYCYAVDLERTKLLFIMLMVANLFSFIVGLSEALAIPDDWNLVLFYIAGFVPLSTLAYWVMRHKLWPVMRDLQSRAWRLLWIIPAIFTMLLVFLTFADLNAPMGMQVATLVLILVCAYVIYFVLITTLQHTAEQTRQAERALAATAFLSLQKGHYATLMSSIEQMRAARHDFRHQLLVIRNHAQNRDFEALQQYCDDMEAAVPQGKGLMVCEHFAANAVAAHYLTLAEESGIRLDVDLGIPEDMGEVPDGDVCVVVGNLLENALEACLRLPETQRFIRVRTRLAGGTWVLGMDNSYDGHFAVWDEQVQSSKRGDSGIGLASVRAAAQRHGGDVEFRGEDGVFYSSVYMVIR